MNHTKQRIAIAKACGWVNCYVEYCGTHAGQLTGYPPDNTTRTQLPDYHSDLNAMHEAEKTLKNGFGNPQDNQWFLYWCHLGGDYNDSGLLGDYDMIHATAAQRAEAFLRTIGKWEDANEHT